MIYYVQRLIDGRWIDEHFDDDMGNACAVARRLRRRGSVRVVWPFGEITWMRWGDPWPLDGS